MTLQSLLDQGFDNHGLRSESWDDLEEFAPDLVVTVCDRAAGEVCPLWMATPVKLHWGLADPSAMAGDEDAVAGAFAATIARIRQLRDDMLALDLDGMNREALITALHALHFKG